MYVLDIVEKCALLQSSPPAIRRRVCEMVIEENEREERERQEYYKCRKKYDDAIRLIIEEYEDIGIFLEEEEEYEDIERFLEEEE